MNIKCNGVFDLNNFRVDAISRKISLYLDTNIWYWLTYPGAQEEDQQSSYASFVFNIYKNTEINLLRSRLIYGELANIIERDKFKKYRENNSSRRHMTTKEFRKLQSKREDVVDNVEASLKFMDRITVPDKEFIEVLDYISGDQFVKTLRTTTLDGTDALMANFISQNNVKNIVTDDRDFLTVSGINVFTYNRRALAEAKDHNKLLS